jgi:hypothetical protein
MSGTKINQARFTVIQKVNADAMSENALYYCFICDILAKRKDNEQTPHIPIRPDSYPRHRVGRSGISGNINHLYGQYQQPDGKEH